MNFEIVHVLPEDQWRDFVQNHPEGNIFHTPDMFQVFSRTKGYRPELWAVTKCGQILALFLVVEITLIEGLLHRVSSRSVSHGGVLCVPGAEGQGALSWMLSHYIQDAGKGSLFTELRNVSETRTMQPTLNNYGFLYEEHLNYLIDVNCSPEAVFQRFGRRTRKNIKRGLNQGKVVVELLKEKEQIGACYDLLCRTYRAARVPLADRSLFECAFDLLGQKGMIRFSLASVGQNPCAVSVELLHKDIIYGWYGGMDRAFSRYVPNEILMWHILKWVAERGYRLYDFGGAGKPDENYGVRNFKAKFGGQLVSFGRNIHVHSSFLLSLSQVAYRIFRRFLNTALIIVSAIIQSPIPLEKIVVNGLL